MLKPLHSVSTGQAAPAARPALLNAIDRAIAWAWPQAGVRRLQARTVLAHYEAARPSPHRKLRRDGGAPNTLVEQSAVTLRDTVRYLARNHDLVVGALNVLVNNTIGPQGIGIEPQPRRADGTIHDEYARALKEAWRDWTRRPEVTWTLDWAQCQRMLALGLYRDGEAFAQHLQGRMPTLDHGTRVPYSLELFEPDLVPMSLDDGDRIRQGIERSAWGRPLAYYVYKGHPQELGLAALRADSSVKRVPADRIMHLAHRERLHQLRGITRFASVITRVEDLKDYEESERIAAKVAAMLTAYVKRSAPVDVGYEPQLDDQGQPVPRQISMAPGTIVDTLVAGEEIGLIDTKRPNPNLVAWRAGQLRMFAAGIGATASSVSRNYDGTFSAQRQELVEGFVAYASLTDYFAGQCCRPVWEAFVRTADLAGIVPIPRDVVPGTEDDCLYIAPAMPWIDPAKEITAWTLAIEAGLASEYEGIRARGHNPHDVLQQIAAYRKAAKEQGLTFSTFASNNNNNNASSNTPPTDSPPESEEE